MRRSPLILLAVVLLAGLAPTWGEEQPPPQLRNRDGWLVDPAGRVVLIHGVNAIWKRAPYVPPDAAEGFTAADADWLVEHGFNAVRVGTLWVGVSPDAPGVIDHDYLEAWERVIQLLAERGIWILFDFHQDMFNEKFQGQGIPDWALHDDLTGSLPPPQFGFPFNYFTPHVSEAFDNLWANVDDVWDGFRDAWVAVAERWADQPYSMGYDLLNEPWAGQEWPLCIFAFGIGCPTTEPQEIQPTFEHVLAGIREVDPDNIVWFEPQLLAGGTGNPTYFEPVEGEDQLGYSWHNYCPHAALFQSLQITNDATGCEVFEEQVMTGARETATRMRAVQVMTEFGASDNVSDIATVAGLADQQLTGWMYWAYKNWADPTTQSQESGEQGLFTDDADLSSLKMDKARALVRTYPRATAGIPLELSFDADTGAFTYRYAPDHAIDVPTEIFVSPLHAPDGYEVTITGGFRTSPPEAPVVTVIPEPGATEVAVQIERGT